MKQDQVEIVGKVFAVVGPDMRQCLICDAIFTRQGAAEHAAAETATVCTKSGMEERKWQTKAFSAHCGAGT
jgi:hypothetical protein